jgi:hypothetical protein
MRSHRAVDEVNLEAGKEEPAPVGNAGPAAPLAAGKPANG